MNRQAHLGGVVPIQQLADVAQRAQRRVGRRADVQHQLHPAGRRRRFRRRARRSLILLEHLLPILRQQAGHFVDEVVHVQRLAHHLHRLGHVRLRVRGDHQHLGRPQHPGRARLFDQPGPGLHRQAVVGDQQVELVLAQPAHPGFRRVHGMDFVAFALQDRGQCFAYVCMVLDQQDCETKPGIHASSTGAFSGGALVAIEKSPHSNRIPHPFCWLTL